MPVFESDHEKSYERCIEAAFFRLKWKDIFDVKEFYKALRWWLVEYGWKDMETEKDYWETYYFESIGFKGDKEIWLRWRPQKILPNPYYRYHMDLDFHFLYLVPTEVTRGGKTYKKNIYNGEVEIKITALVEYDIGGKWSGHKFLKNMQRVFVKRIMKRELYDEQKRELYREASIFHNFIKQWLKMKRFLPYEDNELFFNSLAFPRHKTES